MASRYGQYCPVSLATEILGERWTILVILALMDGVERFNDLQRALPRISPSTLNQRLKSLEQAGILGKRCHRDGTQYHLSAAGEDLGPIILELGSWGHRWARDLEDDDLDPRFLGWSIHLRMNTPAMPKGRTVLEFDFPDAPPDTRRFWIITNDGAVEMCIKHPGHESDLYITSEIRRFVEAWRGFRSMEAEVAAGRIRVRGPRDLQRAFPRWLLLSALADADRERPGRDRTLSRRTAGCKDRGASRAR